MKMKKDVCKLAVEKFGTTDNIYETGYIMPDGTQLDFSGKKWGGRGGTRQMDHREISDVYPYGIGGSDAMVKFMDECKAIRFSKYPSTCVTADMVHKPTSKQMIFLGEAVDYMGCAIFEKSKKSGSSECFLEGEDIGVGVHYVRKFISKCFKKSEW